jgi:hypothetical protein
MSEVTAKADIQRAAWVVGFVPFANMAHRTDADDFEAYRQMNSLCTSRPNAVATVYRCQHVGGAKLRITL